MPFYSRYPPRGGRFFQRRVSPVMHVTEDNYSGQVAAVAAAYLGNPSTRIDKEQLGDVITAIRAALARSEQREVRPGSRSTGAAADVERTGEDAGNGRGAPIPTFAAPEVEPEPPVMEKASPAAIRRSIGPDHLISFIDGRTYKTLKRHLAVHGHTPASYREHFGLGPDYPMVAPNYSATRSALAKSAGLGRSDGLTPRAPKVAAEVAARPVERQQPQRARLIGAKGSSAKPSSASSTGRSRQIKSA